MKKIAKLLVVALAFIFVACGAGEEPNVELIQDMMQGPGFKSQEGDATRESGSSMRLPPEGTVPRGFTPYKYKGDPQKAQMRLANPIRNDQSPEMMTKGQELYETYCLVCHGAKGLGDGPVAAKMPLRPPSLVSRKVRNFNDGRLYHIITDGQGVMLNYANQILAKDRWAVVNYVRSLQKSAVGN